MRFHRSDPTVAWLLDAGEPAIQYLTLINVLKEPPEDPEVIAVRKQFVAGRIVRQLLEPAPVHVYAKWQGAFWRLTALVELGVPPGQSVAEEYLRAVLGWLHGFEQRGYPPVIAGVPRPHAVWHGHALAAAVALHWPETADVAWLVDRLLAWQWADGGWNCDRRPRASCSSVHESLGPLWGLAAYHRATADTAVGEAIRRAVEFFFARRLFKSRRTGEVINPAWLHFRHPTYYHYNVLQALWVFAGAGLVQDGRAEDALALVISRRRRDGRWNANGRWWKPPARFGSNVEAVDWGPSQPNLMVTLKALTVLIAVP